jgi:hypothetical protein
MHNEKFIAPFIEFVKKHFIFEEHYFMIVGGVSEEIAKIPKESNVRFINNSFNKKSAFIKFSRELYPYMMEAEKIILHGLFGDNQLMFLYLNQTLLNKCHWIVWGADLYVYNKPRTSFLELLRHYVRKTVYKKIGYLMTGTKGEYELAKAWYGVQGEHISAFVYTSNLYKEYDLPKKSDTTIYIQVGNSGDPTNKHLDIFQKLKPYAGDDIKIIVPLSYGDPKYIDKVITIGRKMFGAKFDPLTTFFPFDQYLQLLAKIDIAIFNHNRQQGMGNIITLLGLGKKVYMRSSVTTWDMFRENNITLYDVKNVDLTPIPETVQKQNIENVKTSFSEERFVAQLQPVFGIAGNQ